MNTTLRRKGKEIWTAVLLLGKDETLLLWYQVYSPVVGTFIILPSMKCCWSAFIRFKLWSLCLRQKNSCLNPNDKWKFDECYVKIYMFHIWMYIIDRFTLYNIYFLVVSNIFYCGKLISYTMWNGLCFWPIFICRSCLISLILFVTVMMLWRIL